MGGRWPFTAEKIAKRLALIAPHIHRRRLELAPFRLLALPKAMIDAPICADPTHWDEIPFDSYWGHADLNFVLKSSFAVPDDWTPAHIALHLPLGVLGDIFNHPEALVHVDTKPIGSADRYHHSIPLDPRMADGNSHTLSLLGWTGLSSWPPDPTSKAKLLMGRPALVERDPELLAFHRLASTAHDTLSVLDPGSREHQDLLEALDTAFKRLDTRDPLGAALYASVPEAHAALAEGIAHAGEPLDITLHGIGHAHMDIAYLWPIDQIRLKNARTYSNVLRLMEQDPEFHFSHSQPQLYAMVEADYPDLFRRIKSRVAEGRWEVMGGMWVEPDLNIPGPEAMVRQLTLGRTYFAEKFGPVDTPILWLPDTFGFPAQIPQLMRHAGLKWFATNKLNWNQLNKVPWATHHWEGLDGSRVLAHILTTPRDVQYLPFPTNYKSDLTAAEVLGTTTDPTLSESTDILPICFGYGDGGGGPTEDLLAKAHAFQAMPGMPRFKMSTVRETFEALERIENLPVWRGEHYMEGHRGVLTSQGWIKRANRKAERGLHEAEALSVMAGRMPDLGEAWQLLCLNQFHDIVTGTSIPVVFEDARRDFDKIAQITEAAALEAAKTLALDEFAIANTSALSGPQVVEITGADAAMGQPIEGGMLVHFENLPAYGVTPLSSASPPKSGVSITEVADGFVLEHDALLVAVNRAGQLTRVHEKSTGREVLAPDALGNVLQAFEDRPICWDAWDIDPHFEDRMDIAMGKTTAEIIETGPIRASLCITTHWRTSKFTQVIRLSAHSNRLDFVTTVDWHETHTLLKAAFPTSIQAPTAQFDIQWGHIDRSTTRDSDFDAARFEVPAQKWARLASPDLSVAVLNDCKYGYDVHGNVIRITLIKSATSPDPQADQGHHQFTYSLLPWEGDALDTVNREAYALNTAPRVIPPSPDVSHLPIEAFVACSNPDVILETLKPGIDGRASIIRLYEASGRPNQANLIFRSELRSASTVDFFENHLGQVETVGNRLAITLEPFKILTLRVELSPHSSQREAQR